MNYPSLHVWIATPEGVISRTMNHFNRSWGCTYPYREQYRCLHLDLDPLEVWDFDTGRYHDVIMYRPAATSDHTCDAYTPHPLALPLI